jgi:serine/threonine-protein kinase
MHAHQKPLRPSKRLGRAVHPALEDVVMQCLEKNPDRRPQTARELAEMLELLHFETPWNGERARLWWRRERPTEEAVEPAADRAGAADVDSSAQEAEPTA